MKMKRSCSKKIIYEKKLEHKAMNKHKKQPLDKNRGKRNKYSRASSFKREIRVTVQRLFQKMKRDFKDCNVREKGEKVTWLHGYGEKMGIKI
jgi:hypothetical protein